MLLTRVIADEHRPRFFLSAGRVRAAFLIDGFVRGTWKVERARGGITLVIESFEPVSREVRDALAEEGERLVRFVGDGAVSFEVRFAEEAR